MSVLAKEITRLNELSENYIQEGFSIASQVGELLKEAEELAGTEKFPEWLKENCSITESRARGYIRLFSGKTIKLEIFRENKKEKQ